MIKLVTFLVFGLASVSFADCRLVSPIDIGTNDPRVSIQWDQRIVISQVTMDPMPEFQTFPGMNPPASHTVAVELYSPTGICEGGEKPLGAAFGLTSNCSAAFPQGAWTPAECTVDTVEHGRQGMAHAYYNSHSRCETRTSYDNGLISISTVLTEAGGPNGVKAQIHDHKLISLEVTVEGKSYCVRSGKKVTPHYYGGH